ncbi:hypothetical protein [Marinobacter sp.]|uniref:hypothetical protein n=1 Tax=Marinobacter sp. TaxID=50741 RepID=UPI00384E3F88
MAVQKTGDRPPHHRWRKRLLVVEFGSLAALLASMVMLAGAGQEGSAPSRGWLLVPAIASLLVFLSFLGLMYLRWVHETGGHSQWRHRVTFGLLTLTLLGIWIFGIARTWISMV